VSGLVQAPFVQVSGEIVVGKHAHRVHGAPVAADFTAAVRLSGGGETTIRTAAYVDIPDPRRMRWTAL